MIKFDTLFSTFLRRMPTEVLGCSLVFCNTIDDYFNIGVGEPHFVVKILAVFGGDLFLNCLIIFRLGGGVAGPRSGPILMSS